MNLLLNFLSFCRPCRILLLSFWVISSAWGQKLDSQLIRLNQLGFYPSEEKIAIVVSDKVAGDTFLIRRISDNSVVYEGKLSQPRVSAFSDKKTIAMNFSDLKDTGEFVIEIPSIAISQVFSINNRLLDEIADAGLKAFYYQRTAIPIEEKYAGKWNRPLGHPDDKVMIHPSAVSPDRPAGSYISSPKGWYDAGDYNKYIVNSGFTVAVLMSLYEDFTDYVEEQSINIPESNNNTPNLLDEVFWNLDWMLTMQDPFDGGVYHKLTTPNFEGFIKPIECKQQRYVVAKSVTATLDFAASMAQAARIYSNYEKDYPGMSDKMLNAARLAFDWAIRNPDVYYRQKEMNETYEPAVNTGGYEDRSAKDEFFWAATELYITTGDKKYMETIMANLPQNYTIPTWGKVDGLGAHSLIRYGYSLDEKGKELGELMKNQLLAYTDSALKNYQASPYHAPYGRVAKDFFWGCNSDGASNQGMAFIYAWNLTLDNKYLTAALNNMDYILGRNATGYCYITGFGTKSTRNPHHRLAASDGIDDPIPGFLAGGPNPGKQDGCDYPSDIPDECYADVTPSYASNEIAINWQGLFTYFACALDAILSK